MPLIPIESTAKPPTHKLWYRFIMFMLRNVVALPPARLVIKLRTKPYRGEIDVPSIFVFNHSSDLDFIATVDMFRPYSRYIISDAVMRKPIMAGIAPLLTDFIFRRKGERADEVMGSVRLSIADGVCVGIAPEGGVTQNGVTAEVRPKTGQLIKECGCGFVTMTIRGMYFNDPTWARNMAHGPIFGEVVGVYTREQTASMTADEINETIARDIRVNHYEWIKEVRIPYDRECRAECMERTLYRCPRCEKDGDMHSKGDDLFCGSCGYRVTVDEYGLFTGDDAVFDNMYDWDMWQTDYMRSKVPEWMADPDKVFLRDEHMRFQVIRDNAPEILDEDVTVEMNAKAITVRGEHTDRTFLLEEIGGISGSVANGFGMSCADGFYQLRSSEPFCNYRHRMARKFILEEHAKADRDNH